ncbi:MAG: InlB B-repeat-containing protein, partial [Butyrivibrio sp.]|nr:InlB B-repeat-containing protein [Butyrivibrio sp.]
TITFNAGGGFFENEEGTLVVDSEKNKIITSSIDDPVWEGHEFIGWFLDEALSVEVDLSTYVFTENSVLFASWQELSTEEDEPALTTANPYGFTLDANGGVFPSGLSTAEVSYITRYLSADQYQPSRDGYAFTGWYEEPSCLTLLSESYNLFYFKTDPVAGHTYYAGWTEAYKLTYVFGETGSEIDGVSTGYYWNYSNNQYSRVTTISYLNKVGDTIAFSNIPEGNNVRNTDLHYSFTGWYTDPSRAEAYKVSYISSERPTGNTTYYAGYEKKNIVITLNAGDAEAYFTTDNLSYVENSGIYTAALYAASVSDTSAQTHNVTIPSFSAFKNSNAKKKIEGWYLDAAYTNKVIDGASGTAEGISDGATLYAKWEADDSVVTVTFDLNSSTAYYTDTKLRTKQFVVGGTYYTLGQVNNTDLHYKFLGFSESKTATKPDEGLENNSYSPGYGAYPYINKALEYSEDTTLYGVWSKEYNVATFDATSNGKLRVYNNDIRDYEYVQKTYVVPDTNGTINGISDPVANSDDLAFAGWYVGSTRVDSVYNYKITKDTTFTAKYAAAYTVTMDAKGGRIYDYTTDSYVEILKRKVASGEYVTLEEPSNSSDKKFDGWYYDEAYTRPIGESHIKPTGSITVYAKWLSKHAVTFDYGEGTSTSPSVYYVTEGTAFGAENSLPDTPIANSSDKAFAGWYTDPELQTKIEDRDIKNYVVNAPVTFYAKYAESFTVTFVAEHGFVSKEGTSYSVKVPQGEKLKGKYPTVKSSENTVFKGWFEDEERSKPVSSLYDYTVEGNITFYAAYTDCYILTFHANQTGAKLDGSTEDVKVKVVKGTAYRFGTDKEKLFSAPSLDWSEVTANVVPQQYTDRDSNYRTISIPSWSTKPDGTGPLYVFGSSYHLLIDGNKQHQFNMYGFVPTGNMDFYIKWAEPVKVSFRWAGHYFSQDPQYDVFGTLSEDRTTRTLKVPKGTAFAELTVPNASAWGEFLSNYTFTYTYDAAGRNSFDYYKPIEEDVDAYFKVLSSSGSSSSTYKKVILHAKEGYFDNPSTKTSVKTYVVSSATSTSTDIPKINDDNLAFCGWYTDEACTKLYNPQYQVMRDGYWYITFPTAVNDLYAGYAHTYTVTLNANGGYFDEDSSRTKDPNENLRNDNLYEVKASPAGYGIPISDYTSRIRRDGDKIFAGWFYKDGKRAETESSSANKEYYKSTDGNDVTLYARWEDYEKPESITIDTTRKTIKIGETIQLTADVSPDMTSVPRWYISTYSVDYKNNKQYIPPISITSDGLVTGLAAGGANVYAELNGAISENVSILVSASSVTPSISIPDEYKELSLINGDEKTVKAIVAPSSSANQVKWTTSNKDIADVSGVGDTATIIAGNTEGTATITAALGTKKATITVTVSVPIKLNTSTLTLTARPDMTGQLTATLSGADLLGKSVIWTSSNSGVATVTPNSENSKLAVIDPADDLDETKTVTITATIQGTEYTDYCTVTVNPMQKAEKPSADVTPGAVKKGTIVGLKSSTVGADIFFTTDGTEPALGTDGSPAGTTALYTDAFIIDAAKEIKAIAYVDGMKASDAVTFAYTLKTDSWGDIDELSNTLKAEIKSHYESNSNNVPGGIWYIFGNDDDDYTFLTEPGDSGISKVYSGAKISFDQDIMVFHNTRRLIQSRDYTLTYANNVMANVAQKKVPTVTIKGKGTYNSSAAFSFTIGRDGIDSADITSEKVVTVVAGNSAKLGNTKPTLTYAGKKLALNKDYELKYYEGNAIDDDKLIEDPAKEILTAEKAENGITYLIQILGKEGSNFTGSHSTTVKVVPVANAKNVVQVSKLKVTNAKGKAVSVDYDAEKDVDLAAMFDNGEGKEATAFVKNGKTELVYGVDYTIREIDTDKRSAGKHSFVIVGKPKDLSEAPEGTVEYVGEKTFTYEIKGVALSKVKIAGLSTSTEYKPDGSSITLTDLFNAKDKTCIDQEWTAVTLYQYDSKTKNYTKLTQGTDYTVSMDNTGVIGKFTLEFTGINGFTGVVRKTISVKANNLKGDADLVINVADATYVKTGAKPTVTVTVGGVTLNQGIDYTVNYKNNTKVADKALKGAPYVSIKGIGNYSGVSANKTFSINKGNISQVSVIAGDVQYKENKSGYFFVTPKLMDNGKAIAVGKNKDVEAIKKTDYRYTYFVDTTLEDGTQRAAGETVEKTDKVPVGTTIVVTAPVTCSDKSPYVGDVTEVRGYYRIIGSGKDISKYRVTVKPDSKSKLVVSNGEEIKLTKADLEVATGPAKAPTILGASDYSIVSITNNTGVGTATLMIRGIGEYGGTKTISLKITAKSLK